MATALYTIRQMVGRLLGAGDAALVMGTPTGTYSATGFAASALGPYETSYFVDWNWHCYLGTHKDTSRIVTSFTTSTGLFVIPTVTTAIDVTDLFELHRDYTAEEINSAINLAINMVENEALVEKKDETLTVAASTVEYTIPTGFYTISDIYQEESTADLYKTRIPPQAWQIMGGSTNKLWFDTDKVTLTTGRGLRLLGQSLAAQLALDASTTPISPSYLVQQAAAILHQSRISGSDSVSQRHEKQMQIAQMLADRERSGLFIIPTGQRV